AFHRTHPYIADVSRFLVGKALGAHEKKSLALIRRELGERRLEVAQIESALLIGLDGEPCGMDALSILNLTPPPPHCAIELIAQDRIEPSHQIGARLKLVLVRPGAA